MQLLQGHVLQQGAGLAICTGLGHELLNALSQRRALVWLGCLEHLLQDPHALGPHRILHVHDFASEMRSELHSIAGDCRDLFQYPASTAPESDL